MLAILKMGGAAITDKAGYETAKDEVIWKLASAASQALQNNMGLQLIIVHGAGSFGHPHVIKHGVESGVRTPKQACGFCEVRNSCAKLSAAVMAQLLDAEVPAVLLPTGALAVQKNKRISSFNLALVKHALKLGLVPVLRGDMVFDEVLGASVCSGDQIVAYLGKKASRIIMASNVEGVMADGKLVKLITRGNFSSISRHLRGSSAADVTGGMAGKIKEIMAIKKTAYVVDARKPARVTALLLGKKAICTKIVP